jgi:hypothetical protein
LPLALDAQARAAIFLELANLIFAVHGTRAYPVQGCDEASSAKRAGLMREYSREPDSHARSSRPQRQQDVRLEIQSRDFQKVCDYDASR